MGSQNCVIAALEKHCDNHTYDLKTKFHKLYRKYRYGVYGSDYDDIAKALQLQIKVHLPMGDVVQFGKKIYKRACYECKYENNHISQWDKNDKTIDMVDKPVKWVTINPMYRPKLLNQIQNIHGNLENPTLVEYKDRIERLSHELIMADTGEEYLIDYKDTNTSTPIGYFTRKFIDQNPLIIPVRPQNYNIDAIKSICQHGIIFSHKPCKAASNFLHLDIKNAYSSYMECEYYSGFPTDLTYCACVKDTSFDEQMKLIKEKEGFAYVKMHCLWTNTDIERWVSLPYLRFYIEKRSDLSKSFTCI